MKLRPSSTRFGVIDESGEDYLYPEQYFVPVQLPQSAEKAVRRESSPPSKQPQKLNLSLVV
jgi:hypothetical protein